MNYIYDIYLNFNNQLYDFFDWNKTDKLIHVKSIPIIKISENNFRKIICNNIQLKNEKNELNLNKALIWNNQNEYKNYILFCDENNVIAIEFNELGKSIKKSYVSIDTELEILEVSRKLKTKNIYYSILSKEKSYLKTRKQINDDKFIKEQLQNMEEAKLKYIYFECFGRKNDNPKIITNKLLKMSKNSKEYINLYNILKLTSTTSK